MNLRKSAKSAEDLIHRFPSEAKPQQRRQILAIHRFRRCTQIKDPNAAIAARGPWVPLVVEAVGLDKFKFAATRLTSLRV